MTHLCLSRTGARNMCRFPLLFTFAMSASFAMAPAGIATAPLFPVQSTDAAGRRAEEIDALMQGMPAFLGEHAASLETIRSLAPRYSETLRSFPNPHVKGKTDFFRRFEFDGMTLYGGMVTPSELAPISVVVTKPHWRIGRGLAVGVFEQAVIKALGSPTTKSPGLLIYESINNSMRFHVRNHRVCRVEFAFYFD